MMNFLFLLIVLCTATNVFSRCSKELSGYKPKYSRTTLTKIDLTESSGTFTSPDYPNNYSGNQKVVYKIKAGGPVEITCSFFNLQPLNRKGKCKDYLVVKDTAKTKYCGTIGPNLTTEKSTPKLVFKSNKNKNYGGFSCSYKLVASNPDLDELQDEAETAYESGVCGSRPSDTCSCSGLTKADSLAGELTTNTVRLVFTNGIPSHDYEVGQQVPNPNSACMHHIFMAVPLAPQKGSVYTEYGLGPVGISFSGGFFFNHYSSPNGDIAVVQEGASFDTCNGHSDPTCRYHYHEVPVCFNNGNECTHVGYMKDGFPVFSFCSHPDDPSRALKSCYQLNPGETGSNKVHYTFNEVDFASGACDLDRANGYMYPNGTYAYIFTVDYPYIMAGYYGTEVANLCYF